MLKSRYAPGRSYLLFATDEIAPDFFNLVQLEFYDYSTQDGQLELISNPNDLRAKMEYDALVDNYIPNELAAPLPGDPLDPNSLRFQQLKSEAENLAWRDFIKHEPDSTWTTGGGLRKLLGYGGPF